MCPLERHGDCDRREDGIEAEERGLEVGADMYVFVGRFNGRNAAQVCGRARGPEVASCVGKCLLEGEAEAVSCFPGERFDYKKTKVC